MFSIRSVLVDANGATLEFDSFDLDVAVGVAFVGSSEETTAGAPFVSRRIEVVGGRPNTDGSYT